MRIRDIALATYGLHEERADLLQEMVRSQPKVVEIPPMPEGIQQSGVDMMVLSAQASLVAEEVTQLLRTTGEEIAESLVGQVVNPRTERDFCARIISTWQRNLQAMEERGMIRSGRVRNVQAAEDSPGSFIGSVEVQPAFDVRWIRIDTRIGMNIG